MKILQRTTLCLLIITSLVCFVSCRDDEEEKKSEEAANEITITDLANRMLGSLGYCIKEHS